MYGLNYTYNIFFGEFSDLTDIQKKVIPLVLEGKNALVISSTASGKTESVIAPICEILISSSVDIRNTLKVLYIVPTRALVNDLIRRTKIKIEKLGLVIAGKTGDNQSFNIKKPQNILFTTPESLDSLLCKYPKLLEKLKFLIIDELHFFDNTYRGDQLRVLIQRLKDNSTESFSIYCMSATINKPQEIMNRYIDVGEICISKGSRNIIYLPIDSSKFDNYWIKFKKYAEKNFSYPQKFLVFSNSKKDVINTVNELKKTYSEDLERILEHHASLSTTERKKVEAILKEEKFAICVSTSTMELGIDIGDISAVILKKPPLTTSSLLQRIGRANRRNKKNICFGIYDNEDDKELFKKMIEDAKNGIVEDYQYAPDLSVCVQQILSLSYQNYKNPSFRLTEEKILLLLEPLKFKDEVIRDVLENLIFNKQLITKINSQGKILIFPDTKLLNKIEENNWNTVIHSNIPPNRDLPVYDEHQKMIGTISPPDKLGTFNLAAKKWKIQKIAEKKIFVKQITESSNIPNFQNSINGFFTFYLPEKYQHHIDSRELLKI